MLANAFNLLREKDRDRYDRLRNDCFFYEIDVTLAKKITRGIRSGNVRGKAAHDNLARVITVLRVAEVGAVGSMNEPAKG